MNAFEQALKARAEKLGVNPPVPSPAKPNNSLQVTVKLILSRNEIEVGFNRYPGDDIVADLRKAGFRWDPAFKIWHAADTQAHRDFCNARFNPNPPLEPLNAPVPAVTPETPKQIIVSDRKPTAWETYTQQIDELLNHFRERKPDFAAGDLQLLAIDAYHKAVFSQQ